MSQQCKFSTILVCAHFKSSAEAHNQATITDQMKQSHPCSALNSQSPVANAAKDSGGSTNSPPSEQSQKPPLGCGCGKCTLSSFIERGCPTPISSTNSFPYLDLSELTNEQRQELGGRLQFESHEITKHFQALVSSTIESLIRQNVSLDRLVAHVMALVTFDTDPVFNRPQVPLLQDCLKELKSADSIPKIFLVLKDYFSFFNYDIIEHIINVLGTDEDKAKLQKYKNKFDRYAQRRIYKECGLNVGHESETDRPNIFVKLDSRYNRYTALEIKEFCCKLSETFHISSKGVLRLCRAEEGCIQLTFQVPSFVQQEIFPLSKEQEMALADIGVIRLTCGEYQFLVKLSVFLLF